MGSNPTPHRYIPSNLAYGDSGRVPGCLVFTSSSASYIPNPFAVMYGATKSGVSAFAASLACEARPRGIHVHSIHPSPVNSRFTAGGGNQVQQRKIAAMDSFYKFASGPEALPLKFISHIGRGAVVADIGGVSVGLRLVVVCACTCGNVHVHVGMRMCALATYPSA